MHREALLAAYDLLSAQPGVEVHVIGEKNLREGDPLLQRLDAIMVPHQAALPAAAMPSRGPVPSSTAGAMGGVSAMGTSSIRISFDSIRGGSGQPWRRSGATARMTLESSREPSPCAFPER